MSLLRDGLYQDVISRFILSDFVIQAKMGKSFGYFVPITAIKNVMAFFVRLCFLVSSRFQSISPQ